MQSKFKLIWPVLLLLNLRYEPKIVETFLEVIINYL